MIKLPYIYISLYIIVMIIIQTIVNSMLINMILIIIDIHPHSSSSSGMIALSLHAAGKRCSVLKAPWQHPWSSKLPGKGRLTSKHSKVWLFQSSQTWKRHAHHYRQFVPYSKLFLNSRQWNQEKKHDSLSADLDKHSRTVGFFESNTEFHLLPQAKRVYQTEMGTTW